MEMRTLEERDRILENLWDDLADIPVDPDTEEIEEQYLRFPAGTHREEIWHWFDERYSRGVAHLLYRDGVDRTDDVAEYIYHKGMCEDCDSSFCAYNAFGICRFPMIGGRRPKLSEDGCEDCVYAEV